jgi:hypothetical protein
VQFEHLAQVLASADDRADNRDPVQNGLKDRERDLVVGRQRDEHERPTPPQRGIGLLKRSRGHGQGDRLVNSTPGDRRILDREMPQATDAKYGNEIR